MCKHCSAWPVAGIAVESGRGLHRILIRSWAGKSDEQIQVKIGPGRNVKYRFLVQVYEAALNSGYKKVAFATSH